MVVDVVLTRLISAPSPHTQLGRWTKRTGADGRTGWGRVVIDEHSMPLMMHGRPEIGFFLCVEDPKYGTAEAWLDANGRDPSASAELVTLELDTSVPACTRWQ